MEKTDLKVDYCLMHHSKHACFKYIIAILYAFILTWSLVSAAGDNDIISSRQRAVEIARHGDYKGAIAILDPLYKSNPDNSELIYDYIAVLSWAENDLDAAALLKKINISNAPLFVFEAGAKSLRRLKNWESAKELYMMGINRFPDSLQMKMGMILTLADSGETKKAMELANEMKNRHADEPDFLLTLAYAAEANDEPFIALHACQRILDKDSLHKAARHRQIMLLNKLGAFARALELALQYPDAVTPKEMIRLRGDANALAVRWGSLPPVSEAERFTDCRHALDSIKKTLDSPECQGTEGLNCRIQARFDRMVAWNDCSQPQNVIEEYERLAEEGVKLPGYVMEAAAAAMLNQRRPEEALQLYGKALELNPKSYHAQTGIFFALIETENFSDALNLIDKTVTDQPKWLYPGGSRVPRSNWRRQAVETYAALGRFFGDDLAEAERRFTLMANEAPANQDLLRELGSIYLSRGWPRRSQNTLQLGLALSPEHRGLRTGDAESHLSLRQYREVETEIAALVAEYPENSLIQRLDRSWRVHNMRELRVDTIIRSGNGDIYGDREWEISAKVFSQPVNYNYRIFAGYSHSRARFLEGNGLLNSYSMGLEFSFPALEATIGTGFNDSSSNHAGLWADGIWHLDDYWSIPFGIEKYSSDTPLRAIHNGIRANAINLGINFRANEGREISLDGELMDFTDGNQRNRVTLSGTQRILPLPTHKIRAFGEISASNNSRLGGPYFNPDSDLSITGGFEHLWRIYRRYDKSFHQKLRLSGGNYRQKGYGSGYTIGLEYAFIIELGNRFNITYGAGRNRNVYDGKPEWSNFASMSLNWRF